MARQQGRDALTERGRQIQATQQARDGACIDGIGRRGEPLRGGHRRFEQDRRRQRTHSAWHRGQSTSDRGNFGCNVAHRLRLTINSGDAIDADIDHRGAGLNPFRLHQACFPNSDYHEVGSAAVRCHIPGGDLTHGDGGSGGGQQLRHRLADDRRRTDYHRIDTSQISQRFAGERHRRQSGTRRHRRGARQQKTKARRADALDILAR